MSADGFYEWKRLDPRTKQPYSFMMRDEAPFAFAGPRALKTHSGEELRFPGFDRWRIWLLATLGSKLSIQARPTGITVGPIRYIDRHAKTRNPAS